MNDFLGCVLFIDFKENITTINGAYYAVQIHKYGQKYSRVNTCGTDHRSLLHDNTPVHTSGIAKAAKNSSSTARTNLPLSV